MNLNLDQISIGWLIISGLFVISFLVQVFYYLFFYLRVSSGKKYKYGAPRKEPVSIVICARNEAENLGRKLPLVLEQDYPEFEVIVVNDCSEDGTEQVLSRLKTRYTNLRSTIINKDAKFRHGKKLALTIGLKCAKYNWVLLTDADCSPAGPSWISQMQKHFVPSNDIVLGYGGYQKEKGLLNRIIRYDTFFIAMQYLSFALAGIPYMGVGRNLAYRRQLFFKNRGFASHLKLESGDDDLFINEVATGDNTAVELSPEAHTYSIPHKTWKSWYRQKCRHLTTGYHYNGPAIFLLGLENASRLLFYLLFLILLINKIILPYVIMIFLVRLVICTIILNSGMNRLNEKKLLIFSPFFDIGILLLNIACLVSNLFTQKSSKWR